MGRNLAWLANRLPWVRLAWAIFVLLAVSPSTARDWTTPQPKNGAASRDWERPAPQQRAGAAKHTYTYEESKRMADELQRREELRQRGWDRKMKSVSGSICRGC